MCERDQVVHRSLSHSQQHPPMFLFGDHLALHRDQDRVVLVILSYEIRMLLRTEKERRWR